MVMFSAWYSSADISSVESTTTANPTSYSFPQRTCRVLFMRICLVCLTNFERIRILNEHGKRIHKVTTDY